MSLRHYDQDDPQAEPVFGGFVSEAISKQLNRRFQHIQDHVVHLLAELQSQDESEGKYVALV